MKKKQKPGFGAAASLYVTAELLLDITANLALGCL